MKKIHLLILSILLPCCLLAQNNLSVEEWRSDLQFLQESIHQDYPFLFRKITMEEFDAAVEQLNADIPALVPHQIITRMVSLVASFGYGHTYLPLYSKATNFHQIPINLYQFEDGLFIEGVHKKYQKSLGARVLEVEGVPVKAALEKIRPVVSAENEQYFKAQSGYYLTRPEILHTQDIMPVFKPNITLTLEKDGQQFKQTFQSERDLKFDTQYGLTKASDNLLSARKQDETPLYLRNLDRIYYYDYLPEEKAVYIRHSQIEDDPKESIPAFYERVFDFVAKNEVEKLILDVRLNGGGNNYKNKPIVQGIIRSEKINQVGKFMVIIGRRTFSACQNLINELDNYTDAIFVGEPSSENINFYGDVRTLVLPNSKIPVRLSFAWWQDKPQWENADWMAPHVAVTTSFEEYQNNEDPVLKAALNFEGEGFILDPMAHFTELYMANKAEELRTSVIEMVNDPRYQFFDFEGQLDGAGHRVINFGDLKGAYFIFEMNTQLFPESTNAWNSFAYIHRKMQQPTKAIEYYKKVLALDSKGAMGEEAKKIIKEIEAERDD
ncbi:MAG: hypothetical protein AAF849_05655 [Bacteroidota bacterium]